MLHQVLKFIAQLGEEQVRTGYPIVYTSADSVFQIAAHEDVIPFGKVVSHVPDCSGKSLYRQACSKGPDYCKAIYRFTRALYAHIEPP